MGWCYAAVRRGRLLSSNSVVIILAAALSLRATIASAVTWTNIATGTQTWSVDANWDGPFPNAIGAIATIPSTQTANRTIDFGSGQAITLGTFNIENSTGFFNQFGTANQGQSLTFDNTTGDAVINVTGHTTTTNANGQSIRVPITLTDNLVVNADWVKNDYSAIALNFLAGSMTGPGGITKNGLGTLSFADVDKAFTGPIVINQGRFRLNNSATMSGTSAVTVNDGGQIVVERTGDVTFGNAATTVITLSGLGTSSPPAGFGNHFPGAIRTGTNLNQQLNNNIVLASAAAINQVGATGTLALNGNISGPGTLVSGALSGDPAAQGVVAINGTNTYTGGTIVQLGTLRVAPTSSLGTGTVMIDGVSTFTANQGVSRAAGRLNIQAGGNAIPDSAYLNLTGDDGLDATAGGYADLDGGVNEIVGGLMLAGKIIGAGTYGSVGSAAAGNATLVGLGLNPDTFFAGSGTVTVVAAGVPGDYNGNGTVDGADYVQWRNGGPLQNDFTPGVQASDYDFWRSRFAATTNPGSGLSIGGAVPEPAALTLVGVTVLLAGALARRRIA